jgi:hypothetical protein
LAAVVQVVAAAILTLEVAAVVQVVFWNTLEFL